ncbi:MAG: DEAD/DEAH box helicase [Bacteroidota bacterium]|nr:DEAD/DEAH box helicase [Bacteroidota bacterium]
MSKLKFEDLSLSKEMNKAIVELGYEEATPIQSEAIPEMLKGKDVIGQAQTGTGKTAAFGIPAIENLSATTKKIQVLVMCPTRELAIQVAEEMKKLAKYKKDVSFLPVYGGQPIERQLRALKSGVQIVIGTPGRIMDHIERGSINLSAIKLVVLDEADEMLNMGFIDDIKVILKEVPEDRQTVMFSATMPKPILELTKKFQKDPVFIKVVQQELTVPNIEQIYYEVKEKHKLEVLARIIDINNFKLSLIFCNTKKGVDELIEHLQARGYGAEGLHGDMRQAVRERVLNKFKRGDIEILIATDVAARGLDVENVEAVFNYDMPQDVEYYVHRVGRTGRAGKDGKAFSFVTAWEMSKLKDIQKYAKTKIKLNAVPSFDDVEEMKFNIFANQIKDVLKDGQLKKYISQIEKIVDEDFTSLEVAAALFKMNFKDEKEPLDLTVETFEREGNRNSGRGKRGGKTERVDKNTARLFLTVGKKDKVRPGDILGAIAGEANIPGKLIGDIDLFDKYTFVNVPANKAEDIIEAMQGCKIKGKKIHIEEANQKS